MPCLIEIAGLCERRYKELTEGGCMEDVAADRVFDALQCAIEKPDMHCFDPRDRLFENRLRTEVERYKKNGQETELEQHSGE